MTHWKLASFDLDGTLTRGISTGQHLANKIGHSVAMAKMERKYERGEVTNTDVAEFDATFFKGLAIDDIKEYLEDIPMLADIFETVESLSNRGIPCVLCTIAWSDIAKIISARYGLVKWSGPVLEVDAENLYTGKVAKHFEAEDKVKFIKDICDAGGFSMAEVFHVGDSRSDIELFREVGYAVALNASNQAKEAANASIETESLLDICTIVSL